LLLWLLLLLLLLLVWVWGQLLWRCCWMMGLNWPRSPLLLVLQGRVVAG
jgi:hypothetical protein